MSTLLGYITWNVSPVAFSLGSLEVRWYGILLAIGFVLAYTTLQQIFKKENISQQTLDKFAIWTIVWCVVGLRLCHCLIYDGDYYLTSEHWKEIFLPIDETGKFIGYAGLASHGGALAMLLWVIYFCYTRKMNFFWLLDRLCIAIPIAAAFVRCGNLMNHEIVGSVTDVAWAFDFTHCSEDYTLIGDKLIHISRLRHPAQLYEALVYISLFAALVVYYFKFSKGKIAPGRTSGIMVTTIFVARFLIEFVKADQVAKEASMTINYGQQLSIPFILIGIGLIVYSFVQKDKIPQYVESQPSEPQKNNQ
ncbi:MAG: prolipoprotein diacylglyceryl transferase [Bacteroidales bacterium]|nr:prolipoprotein diacylglyceryl transferase [Bacteroidales bacterium]